MISPVPFTLDCTFCISSWAVRSYERYYITIYSSCASFSDSRNKQPLQCLHLFRGYETLTLCRRRQFIARRNALQENFVYPKNIFTTAWDKGFVWWHFMTTKEIVVTYFWLCNQIVNSRAASTRGQKLVIRLIYWRRVSKEIWHVHIIVLWSKIFCYTSLHRNTLEEINQGWLCCANSSIDNDKLRLCYSIMDNDYDDLGLCWANTANDNEKLYFDWANTANNYDEFSLCCANMETIIKN